MKLETILAAIAAQKPTKTGRVPTISDNGNRATVYILDAIGGMSGQSASAFQRQLEGITAKEISVRINSPGGNVFEGLAIYQMLKAHPAKVTTYIDGVAASIASIIALAGDEIIMGEGALLMIHDASAVSSGNADQLRKDADLVSKVSGELAQIYSKRSGKPISEIRTMMTNETWMNAKEAVENGFADRVAPAPRVAALWKPAQHPLPVAAMIAAGITSKPQTRRQLSAEIDKLRDELARLEAEMATPNPHTSSLADLNGSERTKYFRANRMAIRNETCAPYRKSFSQNQ